MKAAFLLLSTSLLVGADAPPATGPAPTHPAPAVTHPAPAIAHPAPYIGGHSGGCSSGGCGATYHGGGCGYDSGCCENTWCERQGLFDRLRGRFSRGNDCCDDGCGGGGLGLFDRLRGRFSRGNDCCDDGCGATFGGTTWGGDCCDDGCGNGGLFSGFRGRFRGIFNRGGCDTGCGGCDTGCGGGYAAPGYGAPGCGTVHVNPAVPTPVQPGTPIMPPAGTGNGGGGAEPLPMGGGDDKKPEVSPGNITVPSQPLQTGTRYPFEPSRQYVSSDYSADYSNLTGKLCRVSVDGGLWILRYAPLSEEDPNGGGVVLARDRSLDSYRDGDTVSVTGEIIAPKGSKRLGGPLYRVSSIRLISRDR